MHQLMARSKNVEAPREPSLRELIQQGVSKRISPLDRETLIHDGVAQFNKHGLRLTHLQPIHHNPNTITHNRPQHPPQPHPLPLFPEAVPDNPMCNRHRETTHAKRPEQQRAVRSQVRTAEAREERDSRTGDRERRDEPPVGRAEGQVAVAGEGIVDKGDGGAPHQDEDALEVQLHIQQVDGLAVRHERVEGGRQGEAERHAQEVCAAYGDVGGCGSVVPSWYLDEDQCCEAYKDQGPENVGPDVDCLIWQGESS